eukprot:5996000-Pyramimonas_sp.AAC.1
MRDPTERPAFTANGMTEEWRNIWRPESFDGTACAASWLSHAQHMRRPFPQSKARAGWVPSWKQFLRAIARGKGSAGYDGWAARELKMMSSTFVSVVQDLCDLAGRDQVP